MLAVVLAVCDAGLPTSLRGGPLPFLEEVPYGWTFTDLQHRTSFLGQWSMANGAWAAS